MFVVVLTTNISTKAGLRAIGADMDKLHKINNWSADLEDSEHIIRIFMEINVLPYLSKLFRSHGYLKSALNIYNTALGVEYSVRLAEASTTVSATCSYKIF
jgi:hypothetical protein